MLEISPQIKTLRSAQWVKNFLIFAPLFFVEKLFDIPLLIKGAYLFVAFSALASSVYIINDLFDKKEDKLHPQKKLRPIAAGQISLINAILLIVLLLTVVVISSLDFPIVTIGILATYFVINILYSMYFKRLVIVDIFFITSMYLMRIFAGGALWHIYLSPWIILCTFFLALFLISAKRRAEFNSIGKKRSVTRKVMQFYNKDFLDHILTITTTATLVTYSLYAVSAGKFYLVYSVFFVAFGLLRYLYLVYQYNIGEAPERILFKDAWLIITIVAWVGYSGFVFYLN